MGVFKHFPTASESFQVEEFIKLVIQAVIPLTCESLTSAAFVIQ